VVFAGFGSLKPHCSVLAGHGILLHAEGWDVKAVNYVLGSDGDLDRASDGNVEFVDLSAAVRMLRLPHPLLADDVNILGTLWRN
jgi:hypothetical protein